MTWEPGMTVEVVIPERQWLHEGQRAKVERVIHGGRWDRDGLNGDGLVLEGIALPRGFTGFDARRFVRVECGR